MYILGFLQYMRWNVKGVNNILVIKRSFLTQQVSLYLNIKKILGKRVSKNIIQLVCFNYHKGKSEKEIADMWYQLKSTRSTKKKTSYQVYQLLQFTGSYLTFALALSKIFADSHEILQVLEYLYTTSILISICRTFVNKIVK